MRCFLGLDVGTTNVKLSLFDERFKLLSSFSIRTPISHDKVMGEVIRVENLKEVLRTLFSGISESCGGGISGLGISSLGETVFPVGASGAVLDGMIWYSSKTQETFQKFLTRINSNELFRKTGVPPSWVFSLFKMMFAYEKFPGVLKDVKWLDVSSFITYLLTGDVRMDKSLSSRTLMMNIESGNWDEEIVRASGIPKDHLPPIEVCGALRGVVSEEASRNFNIPSGIVVTTAGQDHIAAAFAAGALSKDIILNSSGTTEVVFWGVDIETVRKYIENGQEVFQAGFHALDGFYYLLAGLPTGGFSIEWFVKNVLKRDFGIFKDFKHKRNHVFFFPFLRNAFAGEKPGAVFYNLRDSDGLDEMISAVMEGLAFELRYMVERLRNFGLEDFHVVSVGGGTRLKEFSRVKSEVLGVPLQILSVAEATSLGAAMMAGYASGVYETPLDAMKVGLKFSETFYPAGEDGYFDLKYQDYLRLRERLYS